MGGFLFNGCGAADTVSKMKPLKTDMCSNCKAERMFYLAKVSLKIHVFFSPTVLLNIIPTVPLNKKYKKYGIVCQKCKTGRFITEEQMRQFMVADEKATSLLFDAIMHPESAEQEEIPALKESAKDAVSAICQNCGSALPEGDAFCGMCGQPVTAASEGAKPLQMEEVDAEQPENKPVSLCPQCGKEVEKNAAFCGFCGVELRKTVAAKGEPVKGADVSGVPKAEPVQEADAADIPKETALKADMPVQSPLEAKDWKCPLCDTLNPADADCCQLCGLKRS